MRAETTHIIFPTGPPSRGRLMTSQRAGNSIDRQRLYTVRQHRRIFIITMSFYTHRSHTLFYLTRWNPACMFVVAGSDR